MSLTGGTAPQDAVGNFFGYGLNAPINGAALQGITTQVSPPTP